MNEKILMILERSSSTLQKITKNGKTVLEGVFAEFGVENRNGRIYEEKEYLPHLEYLKKDIQNNNLLGELDHPERFEVALGNVSHRISELWYDQQKRQILGRIEVLDTPKGQIAKSLLEAGIPLSISSRAAGTVNEDKTVQIQQIYTYDLVAKPGFESAQLHSVNESANPKAARVANLVKRLNESYSKQEEDNLTTKLGIINENVSILDLSDKFPSVIIREEAKELLSSKNKENKETKMKVEKPELIEDVHLQQWTLYFKNELSNLNERLDKIEKLNENGDNPTVSKELKVIKEYVEKLRGIQEESLNWQSEIAVALNKVGNYADKLAEKSNAHYDLTNKVVKIVDYNAKTLNKTQDWVGSVATVTNAIGETVDHNAKMLNGINEWNTQIAKAVNHLNEWNEEIAPAVNGMHEWT
ncbi:MAG: S80 family phage morphogenetic serine protease, partial [Clostridia bacterium]